MDSKCPFANMFGKPGEGLHKYRIGKFAAVDFFLTIAAAYFISMRTNKSFGTCVAALVALGIVLHRAFGVDTALNELIFRDKMKCLVE